MKKVVYYIIVGLAIALGLLVSKGCRQDAMRPNPSLRLSPNEKVRLEVRGAQIESYARLEGIDKIEHKLEANYHHGINIIEMKDGTTNIVVKSHGFGDDFGVSTDFIRIGVAIEPYFYKDFHALLGLQFINLHNGQLDLDFYGALAYRIPYNHFNNLSVWCGYDTNKHIIGGIFLRFGSV